MDRGQLQAVLATDPMSATGIEQAAERLAGAGNFRAAARLARLCLLAAPANASAASLVGLFLFNSGRGDASKAYFRRGLAACGSHALVFDRAMRVFYDLAAYGEIRDICQARLATGHVGGETHFWLGRVLWQADQVAADRHFEAAGRLDPRLRPKIATIHRTMTLDAARAWFHTGVGGAPAQ